MRLDFSAWVVETHVVRIFLLMVELPKKTALQQGVMAFTVEPDNHDSFIDFNVQVRWRANATSDGTVDGINPAPVDR